MNIQEKIQFIKDYIKTTKASAFHDIMDIDADITVIDGDPIWYKETFNPYKSVPIEPETLSVIALDDIISIINLSKKVSICHSK